MFIVFLRWTAHDFVIHGGVEPKGIIINSDIPISVLLTYIDTYHAPQIFQDKTPIQPVMANQKSYYIINQINAPFQCDNGYRNEFFGISATEDDTVMMITKPDNSSYSVSLYLYEVYSEIADNNAIELTGYMISSSAPVTVISGNLCTYVGFDSSVGTYISAQLPVAQYKTKYVVPNIQAPQNSGYDVYVVASVDGTTANIDEDVYDLNKGDVIVETFPGRTTPCRVSCSHPCNVSQFTLGRRHSDGLFMMSILPTGSFYSSAPFTTSEESGPFYITVIVDNPTPVTDLVLDEAPFSPSWSVFGSCTYATAEVSQGPHVMEATQSEFVIYTYAHTGNWAGGYGYAVLAPTSKNVDFS